MNRKRLSEEKHKSIMYNNRAILFYEIKGLSTKIVRLFVCVYVRARTSKSTCQVKVPRSTKTVSFTIRKRAVNVVKTGHLRQYSVYLRFVFGPYQTVLSGTHYYCQQLFKSAIVNQWVSAMTHLLKILLFKCEFQLSL
jgi:hypothetical protein